MKNFLLVGLLTLLSGISWSQCATGNPGTNCSGPLTVQPQSGNTGQSAITLVDLGLAVPAPAVGQYTLSIASGMLLESDNGNSYHSLVGPLGPQGPQGAAGAAGPAGAQGIQGIVAAPGSAAKHLFNAFQRFKSFLLRNARIKLTLSHLHAHRESFPGQQW